MIHKFTFQVQINHTIRTVLQECGCESPQNGHKDSVLGMVALVLSRDLVSYVGLGPDIPNSQTRLSNSIGAVYLIDVGTRDVIDHEPCTSGMNIFTMMFPVVIPAVPVNEVIQVIGLAFLSDDNTIIISDYIYIIIYLQEMYF